MVQNPSTRQRHGIIALRHLAPVPPRYPRAQHTVRIQNRTSQADESCIGHGNKQEPTPEHSLTLAVWHSRSYRPSSLCYQSIPPPKPWHSLYQANCRHLIARIVSIYPIPGTTGALYARPRMVCAGTRKRVRWVKAVREVGA